MSKEAMQMALHTLEGWANYGKWVWPESALEQAKRNTTESIAALRQALDTEQEPVAWRYALDASVEGPRWIYIDKDPHQWLQGPAMVNAAIEELHASPQPSKPWVGLTDQEVMVAAYQAGFDIHEDYENEDDPEAMHWWTPDGEAGDDSLLKLRDLIEAKLKERNT